jgi:hypothetical protein
MNRSNRDVRFTPKSGHCRATVGCPLCARSGLMHRSKILIFTRSLRRCSLAKITALRDRVPAFRPTDPAFEPSLYQPQSPPSGNAISRGRDKGPKTTPEIQSTACKDKTRARIPASSGLFALNQEISVCAGLRGGAGRTRTSNQMIMRLALSKRTFGRERADPDLLE